MRLVLSGFSTLGVLSAAIYEQRHCHTNWYFTADVKAATKNKVPLVRSSTLNWVSLCIETSNKAIVLKLHKEYVPICMEVGDFLTAILI